jgi:hypothetical protein
MLVLHPSPVYSPMNHPVTTSSTHKAAVYVNASSRRPSVASVADTRLTGFTIGKRNRFWHVIDPKGQLVCITVYKCGAKEVVRRLTA